MITDHYRGGMVERLGVVIVTVDPSTRRVEAVGKDASVIQISVGALPLLFRWPVEGEYWTIIRENGVWSLENKIGSPDDKQSTAIGKGEAIIQADKVWTPSGDSLATMTDLSGESQTLSAQISALTTRINVLETHRPVGPYVVSSGSMVPGASSTVPFTHNFGSSSYRLLSEPVDAGWGYFVNYVTVSRAANTATMLFINLHASITANLSLEVFLLPV